MLKTLQAAMRARLDRAVEIIRVAVETQRPTRIIRLGRLALEVPNVERAAVLAGLAERIRRDLSR